MFIKKLAANESRPSTELDFVTTEPNSNLGLHNSHLNYNRNTFTYEQRYLADSGAPNNLIKHHASGEDSRNKIHTQIINTMSEAAFGLPIQTRPRN